MGDFWKVMMVKFSLKSSPNSLWLLGLIWEISLFKLSFFVYILANFWKSLGYFFPNIWSPCRTTQYSPDCRHINVAKLWIYCVEILHHGSDGPDTNEGKPNVHLKVKLNKLLPETTSGMFQEWFIARSPFSRCSVARFGKISPLWQKVYKVFGKLLEG